MKMTCATGAAILLNLDQRFGEGARRHVCYGISRARPIVALQLPAEFEEQLQELILTSSQAMKRTEP